MFLKKIIYCHLTAQRIVKQIKTKNWKKKTLMEMIHHNQIIQLNAINFQLVEYEN